MPNDLRIGTNQVVRAFYCLSESWLQCNNFHATYFMNSKTFGVYSSAEALVGEFVCRGYIFLLPNVL